MTGQQPFNQPFKTTCADPAQPAECVRRVNTHGGVEPSSFIHGQESVTVDPFDADDPLRNSKELQDTWADKQHDE